MRSRLPGLLILLAFAVAGVVGWILLPHKSCACQKLTLTRDRVRRHPRLEPERSARGTWPRSSGPALMLLKQPPQAEWAPMPATPRTGRAVCKSARTPIDPAARAFFREQFCRRGSRGRRSFHRILRTASARQPHASRRVSDAGLWRAGRSRQRRSRALSSGVERRAHGGAAKRAASRPISRRAPRSTPGRRPRKCCSMAMIRSRCSSCTSRVRAASCSTTVRLSASPMRGQNGRPYTADRPDA